MASLEIGKLEGGHRMLELGVDGRPARKSSWVP